MNQNTLSRLSLIQELELGVETTNSALSLIQSTKPLKVPIFLIFLTLSTGLERIFKILIGLRKLTDENVFLSEKKLRKYGHDLCFLKNDVIKTCFNEKTIHTEIQKSDLNFIENNKLLNVLLLHLSEFAKEDRYVYMNRIVSESSKGKWLIYRWEEIEEVIMPRAEAMSYSLSGRDEEYASIVSKEIVKCIEKLLTVLARAITIGKMNEQANSAGTLLYDFLFIKESDYGNKKYDLFTYTQT